MANSCVICGKDCSYFTFCRTCNTLKEEGKILKCKKCNTWHKIDLPCKCAPITKYDNAQQQTKSRKTYKSNSNNKYICKDNHTVDSKSERDIDNYLFQRNIKHTPHKEIYTDEGIAIHPDFYLDELDVYIEHWGFGKENVQYTRQNEKKKEYYRRSGLTLIYTYENPDAYNIESALDRKLKFYKKGQVNFEEDTEESGTNTVLTPQNKDINSNEGTKNSSTTNQPPSDMEEKQDNTTDEDFAENERHIPWLKIGIAAILIVIIYLLFF